jgi:hypothetical protein
MIGLRSKEWDVICGALLQAKDNEWEAIERGCECRLECDPNENYKGCFDETQIEIIESLFDKVNLIKRGMEEFEKLLEEGR